MMSLDATLMFLSGAVILVNFGNGGAGGGGGGAGVEVGAEEDDC